MNLQHMDTNNFLIELLIKETQELKSRFITLTKKWADAEYMRLDEKSRWTTIQWAEHLRVGTRVMEGGTVRFEMNFYNSSKARIYDREYMQARKVAGMPRQVYLDKAEQDALKHYEHSIFKLAERIEKKGLDQSKLSVTTTSYLDQGCNISTELTDGNMRVRAFTILAEGLINKPHYRYLIK